MSVENRVDDIQVPGQYDEAVALDSNAPQDSMSGIMKIVPSDVDVSPSLHYYYYFFLEMLCFQGNFRSINIT